MPLSRAYGYEPIFAELEEEEAASILGLEFPLWTEWAPKNRKDLPDFHRRLERFLQRLDRLGVRHAPLQDAEPSWFKRLFGLFTIAVPQRKTAEK